MSNTNSTWSRSVYERAMPEPESIGGNAQPTGHEVLGATANLEIMTREGGGPGGRSPKALELPRVGISVPEALLRNGKVGHDGGGERCDVFGDRSQRHTHFPFGKGTSSSGAMRWRQMDSK
jgi:hypothetical protein